MIGMNWSIIVQNKRTLKRKQGGICNFFMLFLLQRRTSDILQYLSTKFSVCRAGNVCTSKIPISAKFPDSLHPNHLRDPNFDFSLIYEDAIEI